jgi:hypothetical protein
MKSYFCSNLNRPSKIQRLGTFLLPRLGSARPNRATGAPWPLAWEGPSSSYGAPFAMRFHPTWSTRQEEPVLHNYGKENRQGRAGDGSAVQTTLGGSDWLLRWSSGDKNRANRLPTFPSCSSVLQFLRAMMNWTHTARNPWRLGFGVAGKIRRVRAAIYRGSCSYS